MAKIRVRLAMLHGESFMFEIKANCSLIFALKQTIVNCLIPNYEIWSTWPKHKKY